MSKIIIESSELRRLAKELKSSRKMVSEIIMERNKTADQRLRELLNSELYKDVRFILNDLVSINGFMDTEHFKLMSDDIKIGFNSLNSLFECPSDYVNEFIESDWPKIVKQAIKTAKLEHKNNIKLMKKAGVSIVGIE